jgi:hypothetical protein
MMLVILWVQKPESGKKRAAETVLKTPASDKKKAKIATPSGQKTGEKNAKHVFRPFVSSDVVDCDIGSWFHCRGQEGCFCPCGHPAPSQEGGWQDASHQ